MTSGAPDPLLHEVTPLAEGLDELARQDRYNGLQGETCRKAAALLRSLVARVRAAEEESAQRRQDYDNCCRGQESLRAEVARLREHERVVVAADTEAIVNLREVLQMIADYNISVEHGELSVDTEAAAFYDCRKLAREFLKGREEKEGSAVSSMGTAANKPQPPAPLSGGAPSSGEPLKEIPK